MNVLVKSLGLELSAVLLLATIWASSGAAQTRLDVEIIKREYYPDLHVVFHVKDTNERIIRPSQMTPSTISLSDSETHAGIPLLAFAPAEDDTLNLLERTLSLLISLDVTRSAKEVMGENFEYAKDLLKRLVRTLDLSRDYIAIQLVADTTIIGLNWTNSLSATLKYIDDLDKVYRADSLYDIVGAFWHPKNGMQALLHQGMGTSYRACIVVSAGIEGYNKHPVIKDSKDTNQEVWSSVGYVTKVLTGSNWLVYMRPDGSSPRQTDNGHPFSDSCEYTKWGIFGFSDFTGIVDYQVENRSQIREKFLEDFQRVSYRYTDREILPAIRFEVPRPDRPVIKVNMIEPTYDLSGVIVVVNPSMSVQRDVPITVTASPSPASEYLYFNSDTRCGITIADALGRFVTSLASNEMLDVSSFKPGLYFALTEGISRPVKFLVVR